MIDIRDIVVECDRCVFFNNSVGKRVCSGEAVWTVLCKLLINN